MLRVPRAGYALVVIALASCVPLPGGHTIQRRTVMAKRGENTLVAQDGAWCRVTAAAFDSVRVGDVHTCAWKEPDGSRGARAVPDVRPPELNPPGPSGRP